MTREEVYDIASEMLGPGIACVERDNMRCIGRWKALSELAGEPTRLVVLRTKTQAVRIYAAGESWHEALTQLKSLPIWRFYARHRAPLLGPGEHGGLAKQGR